MDAPGVLDGLDVVDLSSGVAGSIATMLLADYGARVVKVEPPGGARLRGSAGSLVWDRGKRSVAADRNTEEGRQLVFDLAARADVLLHDVTPDCEPGGRVDDAAFAARNESLIRCCITGYGPDTGAHSGRPGYDALVQARSGFQWEQVGHRAGPIFYRVPLPSYGAALLALLGISAALRARELTGVGQRVDTSLLQGMLALATNMGSRVARDVPGYYGYYGCREVAQTPSYACADGLFLHPMPEIVPDVLEHLGEGPDALPADGPDCAGRLAWRSAMSGLLGRRERQEWLDLLWARDRRVQPVLRVDEALAHPQLAAKGALVEVDVPGVGGVRQLASPYRLSRCGPSALSPPPAVGEHTEEVVGALAADPAAPPPRRGLERNLAAPASRSPHALGDIRHPLAGITVLDFGLALAGPFGPMLLSDLGAEVVRVDNVVAPRPTDDQIWAACQRGKRSIRLNMKDPRGLEVAYRLIQRADVVHHNMRPAAAARLGIDYETLRARNPALVYCQVTSFGTVGPLADAPGCDQMGQALSGLEHEQGAGPAGGDPTWIRLGLTDHVTAMLSAIGVVQALYHRERTGEGQYVDTDIVGAALLLCSDAIEAPPGTTLPTRWQIDLAQTGLGPLYRLYETRDGWLCLACVTEPEWQSLARALGRPELLDDRRFGERAARRAHADELAGVLAATFAERDAASWFELLDAAGVPCEISSPTFAREWLDDPDLRAAGWIASYEHPRWGTTEQLGRMFTMSATPTCVQGPPVVPGQHSEELLGELGYSRDAIGALVDAGVVGIADLAPPPDWH